MRSVPKLIRRFVGIMLLSTVLLILLNVALFAVSMVGQASNGHPWTTAKEVAAHLSQTEGGYRLSEDVALELQNANVWAIFIDNRTLEVVWQTENLPDTVPMSYSACDIARFTRGYIDGYPTFTGEADSGLAVLGYPKDSYWKHMWPSWDYSLIANLPKTILSVFVINVALIFMIYVAANSRLIKSVKPIVNGIQALPTEEAVFIREKGVLSELAASINKTSRILQTQSRQLRKKENARANWIAGVSHDIRTPLSMVMGYAGQLEGDNRIPDDGRQKARVIIKQSERIKNLVNDLNLASKLEYNMQPIHLKKENLVAIVRQVVVDFINMDIDGRHPIEWETEESLTACPINVDRELIKRAVSNLMQNSISHNGQGCKIYVNILAEDGKCTVTVADDGTGATEEQIGRLNHSPHYMACEEHTWEQRHGLGLLIVRQIMAAHGGEARIGRSSYGGFSVALILPMESNCQ